MLLVVSSLTGDASNVFDWTWRVSPEGTQGLSTLMQMLREHYCSSFMFRELLAINLASIEETPDPALSDPVPSLPEDKDHLAGESTQEGDEGLYIPSFLEEALGGDCNLQVKMACTMQAQEKHDRKCFICQSMDHLMRDHYQGKNGMEPLQLKGPPQNKLACEMAKASPPG